MQRQYKRYSYWTATVVIIVLISLIVVYFQSKDNGLDVYQQTDSSVSVDDKDEDIALQTVFDEKLNYKIGIPKDWRHVVKDGCDTYIHSPSATSIQIQISEYYPQILSVTQESLQSELQTAGCQFVSFGWETTTSYFSIYTHPTSNSSYTKYIERTVFDRKTVIRLVQTVDSQYESIMTPTILAIMDSFDWGEPYPFPEGVYMCYSPFGNYEFAYPQGWQAGSAENTYFFQDELSGATMSVSAYKSEATYAEYTKFDYVDYASQGRANFILSEYSASDSIIYAQSTYLLNGTTIVMTHYLIATGQFEYAIVYEAPMESFQTQAELVKAVINSFRSF